jgi:hypothetical protein
MRPHKSGHGHLRRDSQKLFDTRDADETILLRTDIEHRHTDFLNGSAHVTCQYSPEALGQHS